MSFTPSIVSILRAPNGEKLSFDGSSFVSENGTAYKFEKGVAFLYDEKDVSPFLTRDAAPFQLVLDHDNPIFRTPEQKVRHEYYNRCRSLNTEFMFSALQYDVSQTRRTVEVGVGACDIIRRFQALGHETVAVDFFPWEMQAALRQADRQGNPSFACVSAPMARLPFADHSLDLIYFHAAIHHALPRNDADFEWCNPSNLHDCLTEVKRVLKPREEGGAFFLLGEGIYPENFKPEDRYWEAACQRDPANFYEAWYKISEYEDAYKAAGIYPNLFLWQDDLIVKAFGYTHDGARITIADSADSISVYNYSKLTSALAAHSRSVFPEWISVRSTGEDVRGIFPNGSDIRTQMFTQVGGFSLDGCCPSFRGTDSEDGYVLYGPYSQLAQGRYKAYVATRTRGTKPVNVVMDVIAGSQVLVPEETRVVTPLPTPSGWHLLEMSFKAPRVQTHNQ